MCVKRRHAIKKGQTVSNSTEKIKLLLFRLEASLCLHSYPEYQHIALAVSTTAESYFRCHKVVYTTTISPSTCH